MIFITVLGYYTLAGLLFSLAFAWTGYARILPDAAGSKLRVRLLWMPATWAIWPLLIYKWVATGAER